MAINDINATSYAPIMGQKEAQASRAASRAEITNTKAKATEDAATDTVALSGDRVTMSSASLLVQVAAEVAFEQPDIRQTEVDRLKDLVQSGRYEMDSKNIAQRLIGSELELNRYV